MAWFFHMIISFKWFQICKPRPRQFSNRPLEYGWWPFLLRSLAMADFDSNERQRQKFLTIRPEPQLWLRVHFFCWNLEQFVIVDHFERNLPLGSARLNILYYLKLFENKNYHSIIIIFENPFCLSINFFSRIRHNFFNMQILSDTFFRVLFY